MTAFKPSNIRQGLDAARNPPSAAQLEAALATLSPEQRAAYEANMAQVRAAQAAGQEAYEQALAISDAARVLDGPAGRYLYGGQPGDFGSPDDLEALIAQDGVLDVVAQLRAQRKGEFTQALRQTFNRDEVEQVEDPAERARIAAEQRAARDAARRPFVAPSSGPIVMTRVATRGATQLEEVLAHLASTGLAARPDLVYGVYRVPDRISGPLTPHSEQGRVVEWDVVHAPLPPGAAAGAPLPVATSFLASERWAARRVGEPSVLDEDVALAFCAEAGIGPERCLGIARFSEFRWLRGGDENDDLRTIVRGVVAIHPGDDTGAFERMRAAAPLPIPRPEAADVHVEVLNWLDVARAVHPKIHHPPPVPSPFAYLPSTPQELLRAYLEVVGVRPADSYGVQATVDEPRALVQGGLFTTNVGPKQPCADGTSRMRTRGCEHGRRRLPRPRRVRRGPPALVGLPAGGAAGAPRARAAPAPAARGRRPLRRRLGVPAHRDPRVGAARRPGEHRPGGAAAVPVLLAAPGRPAVSDGWTDLDVTPAGRPAPGAPATQPNPLAPDHDPFASRPSRRRRGWIRLVAGALAVVAGGVATVAGLIGAIGAGNDIEGRAVARGAVVEGGPVTPVAFTVPDGEPRAYSIYLLFGGFVSKDPEQELTVRDTRCEIRLPGGQLTVFRGARQGTSVEIGQSASIGHFTSAPGRATASCAYTTGTRSSRRLRPERVAYVVTPGRPGDIGVHIAVLLGGVTALIAGVFLLVSGWRGRRRAR